MSLCFTVKGDGKIDAGQVPVAGPCVGPGPNNTGWFVMLTPAEDAQRTQALTDITTLKAQVVDLQAATGTGNSQSSPFYLSPSDALAIGGAIAVVWALAWSWRALAKVLGSDGEALD